MKKEKIELMAPVGSFSTLSAACNAGADAIYFGVGDFSMRSGKKNFKVSDINKIREICNSYPRKPKIYLTLNTIVYDNEIKRLEDIIKEVENKIDGVICFDPVVIGLCKKYKIPFIISTQNSISNKFAAKFYRDLGAKRVVLARELNISQIEEIAKVKNLEIEVFVHGAMCVAISGRCFMSQFLFGSSGNRGECLHPCRRSYIVKEREKEYELKLEGSTVMSAKDLCTLPLISKLKNIGVSAFKIEGRGRDERYISSVVGAYRKAIDENLSGNELLSLMKELEKVFNRGFSTGFYLEKPSASDFSSVENSASSTYRKYLGKTVHFYPKIGVILVNLRGSLAIGDKVCFVGEGVGIEEITLKEMEKDNKKIERAEKGEEVGIKIDFKGKKGLEVYKIKNR